MYGQPDCISTLHEILNYCCCYFQAGLLSAAMSSLIISNDTSKKKTLKLQGYVTIGRHPANTIQIDDSDISKHHASISELDDTFIFEDLGSLNGSYINEVKVKKQQLKNGDLIRIGHTVLTYEDEHTFDDVSTLVDMHSTGEREAFKETIELTYVQRFPPEFEVKNTNILRMDYEKLRLGHELMQSIGLELNLKKLLNLASEQLMHMFMADSCVILLVDENGQLEPRVVKNAEQSGISVSISKTALAEVQRSKSAVLLSEDKDESSLSQVSSLQLMGVESVLCAPLVHQGKVTGAIHLDLKRGKSGFTKKDLHLLAGVVPYVTMAVAHAELAKKVKQEAKIQEKYERLLSPHIVSKLVQGELKVGKGKELRRVTIMFADIRGFTRMSQQSSPATIADMLREYFDRVVAIIFKFGGTVEKFIGDEVMALFGSPIPMKKQEDAALACALEIQDMLMRWNKQRVAEGKNIVPVGIGINSGEVMSIGSGQTLQLSCIGNAVNIASRFTGLAKAGEIVVGQDTAEKVQIPIRCQPLPPTEIKGIEGKVQAYVVTRAPRKAR